MNCEYCNFDGRTEPCSECGDHFCGRCLIEDSKGYLVCRECGEEPDPNDLPVGMDLEAPCDQQVRRPATITPARPDK